MTETETQEEGEGEQDSSSEEGEYEDLVRTLEEPRSSRSARSTKRRKRIRRKKFLYFRKSSPHRKLSSFRRHTNLTNFHRSTGRETPNWFAKKVEKNTLNLTYDPKYHLIDTRTKTGCKYSERSASRFKDYEKEPAKCYHLDRSIEYFRPSVKGVKFSKQTTRKSHFYNKINSGLYFTKKKRRKTKKKTPRKSRSSRSQRRPKTSHGLSKKPKSSLNQSKRPKTADPKMFREFKPVVSTMMVDKNKSRVRRDLLSCSVIDFGRTLSREEANRPYSRPQTTSTDYLRKRNLSRKKKRKGGRGRRKSSFFSRQTSRKSKQGDTMKNWDRFDKYMKKGKLVPDFRKQTNRRNHQSNWKIIRGASDIPFKVQKVELLSTDKKVGKTGVPNFKKVTGRGGRYLTQYEIHDLHYKVKDKKIPVPKVNLYLKSGRTKFKDSRHDLGTVEEFSKMTDTLCGMLKNDVRKLNRFEYDLSKAERELRKKEKPLQILL